MDLTGEPWLWLLGAIAALLGLGWATTRKAPHHADPAKVRRQLKIEEMKKIVAEKRAAAAREAAEHVRRADELERRGEELRATDDPAGAAAETFRELFGTPPTQRRR